MKIFSHRPAALRIMYDSIAVIGPKRHEINQNIISQYYASTEPTDILAVAIAYSREGAKYRKQAILYHEKYLAKPVNIPSDKNRRPQVPIFSRWSIYSDLGTLYEKEYQFDKAIECFKKLIIASKGTNPADYTRIGDVFAKIDIRQCVEYYHSLQTKKCYDLYKCCFDMKLSEALEKQAKGYVYKPRNKIALI